MANTDNYIGIAMGLDVTELKAGIKEANKQIQLANSEFKAASSGMENWAKSTEGLNAKIKQLDTVLTAQKSKLSGLQAEYEKVAKEQGENSEAARNLQIQINNQQAVVNRTEREFNNYKETLEAAENGTIDLEEVTLKAGKAIQKTQADVQDAADEFVEAKTAVDKLTDTINEQEDELSRLKKEYANTILEQGKNSKAAKELKSSIDDLNSELEENKGKLNAVENAAEDAGDGFTVTKGAIAGFISNGLTNLVGALKDAVVNLFNLAEETREFRQDIATLETAFAEANFSAETATDTWRDLYAVFGEDDRAVEAANNIARMAKNEQELNEWVQITTGVWGTYQDALPVEALAESAGETAKVGTVTGNLADALNWSSEAAAMFSKYMSEDVVTAEDAFNVALSKCNTEAERQALITDTLTKLYGDAATEYEEVAASVMEANRQTADYTLTQAELAEKIEPVTMAVKGGFNAILASVLELAGDGSLDGFAKDIEGAFKSFIEEMLPKIVDGFQRIIDHKDGLIAGIIGIGTAFAVMNVANMIMGVVKAFKAFKAAQEGATVAQWLLNAAMSANPIGLVIAAISALVAAFIYLWNNCEPFKQFWLDLWDGIKNAAKAVADWFSEAWSAVSEWFISAWQSVSDFFVSLWQGIKDTAQAVADWFISAWQAVSDFFVGLWTGIKDFAISAWNGIVAVFTTIANWFNDNVIQPIWNFIYPFVHNAEVLIKGTWQIIQALFAKAAEWFDENVIQPISEFFTKLWTDIKNMASAAWQWIVSVFTVAATWFNDNVIVPIVNFFVKLWTDIKKGASDAWAKIKEVFQVVSSWFDETVVQPVSKFFSGMWDKLKKGASDAWTGIKETFSKVASFFGDIFSKAWQKVKDVFSTGGKIFDGIKDGIVSAFKSIVNAIIRGINKVVAVPFNAINSALSKIKNVEIMDMRPFSGLISNISVPQIPELYRGGILKKGQIGLLEGKGDEAVIPLERNLEWIRNIANELSEMLGLEDIKRQLQAEGVIAGVTSAVGGSAPLRGNTIINAGMTVNYNGNLSRKELKRLENDNYTALKTRLKTEGAI